MKTIFLSLILTLTSFLCKSQDDNFPRFLIQDGDTIGIVISVEQAQKLDNNSELLSLFKKLRIDCDNLDTHYIQIINTMDQQVALLKINIKEMEDQSDKKSDMLENLKQQLNNSKESNRLCDQIIENKDQEINILKKELRRQKFKKVLSVAGNAALIVVTTILIIKS
jgi:predicted RNase H-like nuclease (RuvC/YqgF family)